MTKVIIAIVVLAVLCYAIWVYYKTKQNKPLKHTGMNVDWVPGVDDYIDTGVIDSHSDLIKDIFISGLAHHCNANDFGIFGGIVFNEKDNPVDKKAMAIGKHQPKKIIGYVPAAILDSYREWCKRKSCHCVGFIYREEGKYKGRARVYRYDCENEQIEKDASKYLEEICKLFGWDIPDGDFIL